MKQKIVLDAFGHVVGFGPDDGNYAPTIPKGGSITGGEDAVLWIDEAEAARAEIERLERVQMLPRITREGLLAAAEYVAVESGAKLGIGKDQALILLAEKNTGYVKVKTFDAEIAQLRKKLSGTEKP